MPERDPSHWLYRLTPDEWLRAAANELARAEQALLRKDQRAGVAEARRAAGMAWNAVLAAAYDESYGRSYMEHLARMMHDETVSAEVQIAARALLDAPLKSDLVRIGPGETRLADAARVIVNHARAILVPRDAS